MTRMKILHCHSTFSLGGKEARAVRLMNVFGDAAQHAILSAVPDAMGARDAIDPTIRVEFPGEAAPALYGKPGIRRYRALTRYMQNFDLVLTYNWGSMDAVGARRLFPANVPPLIHHEDGFNADESERLNWKRNAYRRLMLPAARCLVVPSTRLESIARTVWKQPDDRVVRIPNGVEVALYEKPPMVGSIAGLPRAGGGVVIGTLAGLRPVKNLPRLVRAFASLPEDATLVIVGEGPERDAIEAVASELGVADRVILPGFMAQPHSYIGLFDIFALSSDSEQFPISLVEAMAAGLPAVSTRVGDVSAIVSDANRPFVVPASDEAGFANALKTLANDSDLRRTVGAANRVRAKTEYDETAMIARYARLYGVKL